MPELDPDGWIYGAADTLSPTDEVVRLAQNLARNVGYAVFPVHADKRPATPHGFKDAARAPHAIAELWRRHPGPLIGVATGEAAGLAVLDLDLKHDAARDWWHRREHRLPVTRAYRTRSGGVHLYFRYAAGLRCVSGRPVTGVDVRGEGGYIIFWFAAGLPCLAHEPRATWPEWLTKEIWPPAPKRPTPQPAEPLTDRSLDGILGFLREAPEGEWNSRLFWSARKLRQHGLTVEAAEPLLIGAAQPWNGYEERRARATIRSAWRPQ